MSGTAVTERDEERTLAQVHQGQADIERQTDVLVLRTLTSMVTSAEDLKTRLQTDLDDIIEEYRRHKRGLENEISLAGAERQRLRREAEDERDAILAEARETARTIVQEAEREREALLGDVRSMERRLRALEQQIRTALGLDELGTHPSAAEPGQAGQSEGHGSVATGAPGPSVTAQPAEGNETDSAPAEAAASSASLATPPLPSIPAVESRTAAELSDGEPDEMTARHDVLAGNEPVPAAPSGAGVPDHAVAVAAQPTEEAGRGDEHPAQAETDHAAAEAAGAGVPAASATAQEPSEAPAAVVPAPTTTPTPTTSPIVPPVEPTRSGPPRPRQIELVFEGVPGYQQAAALERAVGDLVPDEEVEIVEFERGQLVLSVQATDSRHLADRLAGASSASLRVESCDEARVVFRYA